MEPTIRKGELSPDDNDLPEEAPAEEITEQGFPDLAADQQKTEEQIPLQPTEEVEIPSSAANSQSSDEDPILPSEGLELVPPESDGQSQEFDQVQSPSDDTGTEGQGEGNEEEYPQHSEGRHSALGDEGIDQHLETGESKSELPPTEPDNTATENTSTEFDTDFLPMPAVEDVPQAANPRKIALVLSGGGARGAFQVGAEMYARQVKGYQWDIIAGVSVGALNGTMLAMHRFARLLELWDTISNDQVYTGGFNLVSLVKILLGAKSFYGNEPLKKMMQAEFEAGKIVDDLHVGAVSLVSGEYVQFTRDSLELSKAILASASIPVVWPPVDVSPDHPAMVDGGVRNITPIGDVLELEPDEIVIINCGRQEPSASSNAGANVLSIVMRALDIMQNEIFVNDMKQFLRTNAMVKEAEQQGCVLHHPRTGRPLKYYPYQVIEPDIELGDVLDFSQKSVQAALKTGVRRARQVLGRP